MGPNLNFSPTACSPGGWAHLQLPALWPCPTAAIPGHAALGRRGAWDSVPIRDTAMSLPGVSFLHLFGMCLSHYVPWSRQDVFSCFDLQHSAWHLGYTQQITVKGRRNIFPAGSLRAWNGMTYIKQVGPMCSVNDSFWSEGSSRVETGWKSNCGEWRWRLQGNCSRTARRAQEGAMNWMLVSHQTSC